MKKATTVNWMLSSRPAIILTHSRFRKTENTLAPFSNTNVRGILFTPSPQDKVAPTKSAHVFAYRRITKLPPFGILTATITGPASTFLMWTLSWPNSGICPFTWLKPAVVCASISPKPRPCRSHRPENLAWDHIAATPREKVSVSINAG